MQPFLKSGPILTSKEFHWSWMALSLALLVGAGVVLYPVIENMLAEGQPAAPMSTLPAPEPVLARPSLPTTNPRDTRAVRKKDTQARKEVREGPLNFHPKVVRGYPPVVPEGIRNRIETEVPVAIRIHVSPSGKVIKAEPSIKEDGLKGYLASRAVEAVRRWQFAPVKAGDRYVAGRMTVHFRFRQSGVEWN